MGFEQKLHERAAPDMLADESVVGAARVLIKGGTKKLSFMPLGPIVASLVADADSAGLEQAAKVDLSLATTMGIVLTNRRMLFYRRSSLNRLKDLLGTVDRTQIRRVEVTSQGLSKPMTITLVDGNVLELEGVKSDAVEELAFG